MSYFLDKRWMLKSEKGMKRRWRRLWWQPKEEWQGTAEAIDHRFCLIFTLFQRGEKESKKITEDGIDWRGGDGRENRNRGEEVNDSSEKVGVNTSSGWAPGACQGDCPATLLVTFIHLWTEESLQLVVLYFIFSKLCLELQNFWALFFGFQHHLLYL